MKKNMINVLVILFVCSFLLCDSSVYANGIYEPSIVVIQDGSVIRTVRPGGPGVPVPKGSKVTVSEFNGHTIITITTPGAPAAGGGGGNVPAPNVNKPRIKSPNGKVYEIPDPDNVKEIKEDGGKVKVTYKDGSEAEVPGTYLPPGTPNPPPGDDNKDGELGADGIDTEPLAEAETLIIDLLDEPWIPEVFGAPLTIDDFDFDFGGIDPFYIGTGLITIQYFDDAGSPDGSDIFGITIPEPLSVILIGLSIAGLIIRKCKKTGKY